MPAELFRSDVRATPARRRASLLPVSLAAHVAAIAVAVLMPVLADGDLPPVTRQATPYVSLELPPPPPPAGRMTPAPSRPAKGPSPGIAPLDPPDGIKPESAIEPSHFGPGVDISDMPGLPTGTDGGLELPAVVVPPPPPPTPAGPLRPGGRIRTPRRLVDVAPVYPTIAQSARVEGEVVIDAIIGEDGRVRDATVQSGHPLLKDAALTAVRQWVFSPTTLNGEPVAVVMTVTVVFRLN